MPRADRNFIEGGFYHVYNRLGRGEQAFENEALALRFVELLREVTLRDDLTILAWCLMQNHYHLAVRQGAVSLDRPIRSLQQRMTRAVNLNQRVFGPLWQGRYKAKPVTEQKYLDRLILYIHLNPVTAGVIGDPVDYVWSGHRELLGKTRKPICDVDEVLRVFGRTRRGARAAYVRSLKGAIGEPWIGEEPGALPWWRLGRPPASEEADPEAAVREKRAGRNVGPDWRAALEPGDFVAHAASLLGVEVSDLQSRSRSPELVRAREQLVLVGVERYALKVKDLAWELRKSASGMSQALARAARERTVDSEYRAALSRLDSAIANSALNSATIAQ